MVAARFHHAKRVDPARRDARNATVGKSARKKVKCSAVLNEYHALRRWAGVRMMGNLEYPPLKPAGLRRFLARGSHVKQREKKYEECSTMDVLEM
jgi:hypothetical protein